MTTATDKRAKRDRRIRRGVCLLCNQEANRQRGLCNAHYCQFYRRLMALPADEQEAWEAKQIAAGNILPRGEARKIRNPSPFEI